MKRLLCLLLLLPVNLWAGGNIYVATTGNDTSGTGAVGSPLATIAHALEHITDANGGWNIILRGGTYHEHDIDITSSVSGTSGAWNTMRSYPGEWAIIDGDHNCQTMMHPVIYNDGYYVTDGSPASYGQYWTFERLGITQGGLAGGGDVSAYGIYWVHGPMKVRYCEVYDNLSDLHSSNPAGIGGSCANNWTIEYNYVHDNGTSGAHGGNDRQIMTYTQEEGTYDSTTSGDIANWGVKNNAIRYNLVMPGANSQGIATKASNRLTPMTSPFNRSTTDATYKSQGDKIHHNIVIGGTVAGIFWQSDFTQIYNNIVEMDISVSAGSGAINTRRWYSDGVDTIYPCVYNNTTINGIGLYNDMDGKYFQTFEGFWVNNIIDSPIEDGDDYPITLYHVYADGDEWYAGRSWPGDFDITGVKVDRNYIYRGSQASGHDILFGKRLYSSGFSSNGFSVSSFETYRSVDLFIQATQESGANKLWTGTTGANKYIAVGTHNLGETGKTIGSNGLGGNHPYLSGVTIPSYIGATNPDDNAWVAGVLALDATYMASATDGSDPSWVEGSTTPAPPTISNVTISNGRVQ